jgi:hypothetical protein
MLMKLFIGENFELYVSWKDTVSLMRELTPQDEERIINRITDEVMKRELETVAIMCLESIKPISFIGSQMGMVFVAPFLSAFGDLGIDYIKFFEKRENVEKLLKKLEEEIKVRDEEKKKAKEDRKLVSDKFGFGLDLLPGFSLQDSTYGPGSSLIGITRKDPPGFLAISFTAADSSPNEISNEISTSLNNEEMRRTLMISQDMTISKVEDGQNFKIKGHKMLMSTYQWTDGQGQRGILESYGVWCDKSKRLFLLTMRTGPLTGQKKEKTQIQDLRYLVGSLKCH